MVEAYRGSMWIEIEIRVSLRELGRTPSHCVMTNALRTNWTVCVSRNLETREILALT